MTEVEALKVRLEARLGLYQFSLSNCRNAEHSVRLRKAIEVTQEKLDRLETTSVL
jgi:hypothetical protein